MGHEDLLVCQQALVGGFQVGICPTTENVDPGVPEFAFPEVPSGVVDVVGDFLHQVPDEHGLAVDGDEDAQAGLDELEVVDDQLDGIGVVAPGGLEVRGEGQDFVSGTRVLFDGSGTRVLSTEEEVGSFLTEVATYLSSTPYLIFILTSENSKSINCKLGTA